MVTYLPENGDGKLQRRICHLDRLIEEAEAEAEEEEEE